MPQRSRPLLLAPLAAAALLAGCGDNPTCVFTTGCGDNAGGPGPGDAATLPSDGQTVLSGAPSVVFALPDGGDQVASTTPIVVVFSESMEPGTALGKIELVQLDLGGFPLATIPTSQALVAGGRVLVILPGAALLPADYTLEVAEGAELRDLTGQSAALADEAILAAFQVDTEDTEEPEVIATFPEEDEITPTTPVILVAFDRKIDTGSITAESFAVNVEGAPPSSTLRRFRSPC